MSDFRFYQSECSGCESIAQNDSEVSVSFVVSLAELGGKIIKESFEKRDKSVKTKFSAADLVTETDVLVEKTLINKIKGAFKDHEFFCEESSSKDKQIGNGPTWSIDPIDGTSNFVHCFPLISVSIAFLRDGQTQVSAVYNPVTEQMFFAQISSGAYLNSIKNKISVSVSKPLSECLCGMSFSSSKITKSFQKDLKKEDSEKLIEFRNCVHHNVQKTIEHCLDARVINSTAIEMCIMASGGLDILYHFTPKEWDIAAAALICTEAGAYVCAIDGKAESFNYGCRSVMVGNEEKICKELSQHLKRPSFDLKYFD